MIPELTTEKVNEFQRLYIEHYKVDLSFAEAKEKVIALIRLLDVATRSDG